jgi:predicted transcriptional regulator
MKIPMSEEMKPNEILSLTTSIVAAQASNNIIPAGDLTRIIRDVYQTLAQVGSGIEPEPERPPPAVSVKRSIQPDYIVCLEDGKKLKMLKRHLMTAFGMTPQQYRERWELPPEYPMVAPNYAKQRSRLAKEIGLGTRARGKTS